MILTKGTKIHMYNKKIESDIYEYKYEYEYIDYMYLCLCHFNK